MRFFEDYADSADSVVKMAVSLKAELPYGSIQEDSADLRELVVKCASCSDKQACATLLANAPELNEAPFYCVNKATLEASRGNRK